MPQNDAPTPAQVAAALEVIAAAEDHVRRLMDDAGFSHIGVVIYQQSEGVFVSVRAGQRAFRGMDGVYRQHADIAYAKIDEAIATSRTYLSLSRPARIE